MVNWNDTFQFDLQQLRLKNLRTGRECALTRNEGLLLQALIDGIAVKQDLIAEVWTRHHAVVTENSYYQLVSLLRKSFGSVDLPGTIVTLPRKGLTLALSAQHEEPAPVSDEFDPGSVAQAASATTSHARPFGTTRDSPGGTPSGSPGDPVMRGSGRIWKQLWRSARAAGPWPATASVRWTILATSLGCGILIATLWVSPHWVSTYFGGRVQSSPAATVSEPMTFASMPQDSIVSGNTTISFSKIPADTALRVWLDVQTRADIPPEQTRHVYITQYRNRYAVLACSKSLNPRNIRCLTVTVSV